MFFISKIEDPIYPSTIWFTNSERLYQKKRHELWGIGPIPVLSGICSCCNVGTVNLIGVFDDSLETLMHEANHAAINIFDAIGLPIKPDACEAFTYYSTFIFRECRYLNEKWGSQ